MVARFREQGGDDLSEGDRLEMRGITKHFGGVRALDNVDFSV